MKQRSDFGQIFRRRAGDGKVVAANSRERLRPGYYVRIQKGNRQVWRRAGNTREEACDYLATLRRMIFEDDKLGVRRCKPVLFEAFADEYLSLVAKTHEPTTYHGESNKLESVVKPYFKGRVVSSITREDVERFVASRSAVGIATRNRDLSLLSAMMRKAVKLGYAKENPVRDFGRPQEAARPVPFVDLDRQRVLIEKCPDSIRSLVIVSLDCGLRQGELLRLEWSDVDLDRRVLMVRTSKNKRPRTVALTSRVVATLDDLKAHRTASIDPGTSDRVFSWVPRTWSGATQRTWKAVTDAAKLPGLRWHDLRHLAAVNLVRSGTPLPDVAKILGHRTLAMAWRYASHSPTDSGERARDLLEAFLSKPPKESKQQEKAAN